MRTQAQLQSPLRPVKSFLFFLFPSASRTPTLIPNDAALFQLCSSMATESKPKSDTTGDNKGKKRKQRYLPHNKAAKMKGAYPLRPGVEGFFITCDGGRERQASHEAINVIDSFYEELVHGKDTSMKYEELLDKPLNKKIKFVYSDDEEEDDGDNEGELEEEENDEEDNREDEKESDNNLHNDAKNENPMNEKLDCPNLENTCSGNQTEERSNDDDVSGNDLENQVLKEPPVKKQCIEKNVSKSVVHEKLEQKSIDKLIEDELKELGDKSKRRFANLDSGCNGVVFVQMRKRDGDPSPKDIVQHMMTYAASTKKHMSRFILRMLPVEVACYASEEEISKAMAPIVAKYFPVDTQQMQKFAVLYEARANTGIDRMKIINSVAKSVPGPHKVDLSKPDKTIVVEIVKTVCLIGVVDKYKELAKYNLRQLTSQR